MTSPAATSPMFQDHTQYRSDDHLAHVHANESDDEHTVTTQVVLGELGQYAGLALRRVESAQLLAEVLDVAGPVQRPEQPAQRVDGRYERQEDVPEPDEDEELLVEQVDRQSTLDDVLVDARLVSHLKLAQSHARETFRVRPVLATDQLFDDVDAVEVVVDLEEGV